MGIFEVLHSSSLLLLLAAFADFLDGAVARAIHAESEFGVLFDSMSDGITFGVAPAVLLIKSISPTQGSGLSFLVVIAAMLYSLCGVLRLVRFNTSIDKGSESKKNFTGLPIPAAAIAAVSANLFFNSPLGDRFWPISDSTKAIVLPLLTLFVGFLMVSQLKFPSLKTLHFRVPPLQLLIATVITAIFVLYGILYRFSLVLAVVSWGYILLALVLYLVRRIVGKKSEVLKAFEPEDENESEKL